MYQYYHKRINWLAKEHANLIIATIFKDDLPPVPFCLNSSYSIPNANSLSYLLTLFITSWFIQNKETAGVVYMVQLQIQLWYYIMSFRV